MSLESGFLKKYFRGIIAKKLSAVETSPETSNQHEFNATVRMREIFGDDDRKFRTDFLYVDDERSIEAADFLTWYDARRRHPTRTEYRMYYPSTAVSEAAASGDSMFICVKQDGTILCIIAQKDATITGQLYWLFDMTPNESGRFTQNAELQTDGGNLEFVARTILAQIGIEYVEKDDANLLDALLERFGGTFPRTEMFSSFARSVADRTDPVADPDGTLITWFDTEEKLFFLMEQHTIRERLKAGFIRGDDVDVDGFVQFSLSVQNRRKSRAGYSLENHICALLDANGILYSHTPVTENRSKPDFLFPDITYYRDAAFSAENLTMLGSKSTCKDRWRQVLAEADRIERKHLLTLEPAISTFQTDEMVDKHLQLVIPASIHKTYTERQQAWLYTVDDFLMEVRQKQARAGLR
ncbi:MAG: restriction endonuclease [Clostridiales bacterium]|nr:restriction endonuclease [Clostridiales bacterium]